MSAMAKKSSGDFPGFLNPMLVKELRQGLRGRYFVSLFLILQVILLFTLAAQVSAAEAGDYNAGAASAAFWVFLCLPVGLLLPLSGFGALIGERKALTLELLQMSHLSSRGIVIGKWLSLVAQILLLISAIFPWAVLRYLLGGVDLVQELSLLAGLTIGGLTFSACAVGLSAMGSRVIRGLIIVGAVFGLQIGAGIFFSLAMSRMFGGGSGASDLTWELPEWIMLCLQCAAISGVALEYGASRVAPPVETHALSIRLLGWIGLLPAIVGLVFERDSAVFFLVPGLALLTVVCAGAIIERFRSSPGSYRGLARLGSPGRFAGLAFYPGWQSGFVFVSASAVIAAAMIEAFGQTSEKTIFSLLLVYGTLIVPAALARLLLDHRKLNVEMGSAYFVILANCAAVAVIAGILSVIGDGLTRLFGFLPPTVLLRWMTGQIDGSDIPYYMTACGLSTAVALFFLIGLALPRWKLIRSITGGRRDVPLT